MPNIKYPFTPSSTSSYVDCIKDAIIYVTNNTAVVDIATTIADDTYIALYSITRIDSITADYIFIANRNYSGNNIRRLISFRLIAGSGITTVKDYDSQSVLLVDNTQIIIPTTDVLLNNYEAVLEPCCVRWLSDSVKNIVLCNEERRYDPVHRDNLDTTVATIFNNDDNKPLLDNGYNVSVSLIGNTLRFQGSPGAGKGLSPDNMWDDLSQDNNMQPVLSVNGEYPQPNGNILVNASSSVILDTDDNIITIQDIIL